MQKNLYKQTFEHVCVSNAKSDEIEALLQNANHHVNSRNRKPIKWIVPIAAMLALSFITVSAAEYFNLGKIFEQTFNNLFSQNVTLTQKESAFFETNGALINQSFSKDGVTIRFDSVVGDSSTIYLPYTIDLAEHYNESTLGAIISAKFYLGEIKGDSMRNYSKPLSYMKKTDDTNNTTNQLNGYFRFSTEGVSPENQILTMVVEMNTELVDTGLNLEDAYKSSGVEALKSYDENDLYNIPNCALQIPLKNTENDAFLQTVAYREGKLILGIQSDNKRKDMEVFLQNKKTGERVVRCDGVYGSYLIDENIYVYTFQIDIKNTDDYIVVTRPEHWFSFPLPIKDTSEDISLGEGLRIAKRGIDRVVVSNLSYQIHGSMPAYSSALDQYCFTLKLKDGTIINNANLSSLVVDRNSNEAGSFVVDMPFVAPISKDDMEAIVVTVGEETLEIPIH